ncbi:CSL zinc finger-domain-containing protein [Penicillium chermesinum]|uniref:Diphthamide biosynthesis protein 4 n=1 Tax=Penicillium chermesinum TaxID=63820 RepID=A0A9W9TJY8_9EURO|nr:CSL zinc finger-domain-containing protein [Penicillium chermesinum]KAJ5225498.1 CSL zinc finger-domain-containing protein [Penicillium chermesinum]KAJ6161276.1 CSL zinc finger-domain-containing protein [Penicillium chermesinum]
MAGPPSFQADYYQILNLPFLEASTSPLSKQQIKLAYHKALLKHHPDKVGEGSSLPNAQGSSIEQSSTAQSYTIDEITTAYKTLSDSRARAEYDRTLRLDRAKIAEREKTSDVFHTGLEIVDLEDLACDESNEDSIYWYRSCRCGDEKGFTVTEDDLEREAEHGEIVIGCRGCSLWLKILFAVDGG